MAAEPNLMIPILTDAIAEERRFSPRPVDSESLIAELQTEIASSTFALADEILRTSFAEMEASIFERISGRLRRELPEMIDALLRERFEQDIE